MNSALSMWFDAMVRAAWQGAIALAVVWILSRCVAALPANCKVWLWRLAFLKLLVALLWVTPVSLPVLPAKEQTPATTVSLPAPVLQPVEIAAQSASPAVRQSIDWRTWLLAFWSFGVLWGIARIVRQWRAAKALHREARVINDSILNDILVRLTKALRLRRVPALYESSRVSSPLLIGVFRPRIILPAGLSDNTHIELMLAHEIVHVRRRDLSWQWLFTICETLFFFHPLIWLARREWTVSTEAACDQLALRVANGTPRDYGSMLVEVVARMTRRTVPAVISIGMFETTNTLKRRLKAMTTNRTRFSTVVGAAFVAVAALAIVPCQLVAETPDAETLVRLKEENARLKQQLDATRAEIGALRNATRAAKDADQAIEDQRRAQEDFHRFFLEHPQQAERLRLAQRELAALLNKYSEKHPDVLAKRAEVERLYKQLQSDSVGIGKKFVPAKPEEQERSRERRALLAKEIELAERQFEFMRKKLENGRELPENLLHLQRELLELKLNQAELNGSKAERDAVESEIARRLVLLQQLQIAEGLLKEQKKRVEVGTLPPGSEIAFEREVLRLKRELAGPK